VSIHLQTFRSPAVVATDVCVALALGVAEAVEFFRRPPVDIRLATATYLALLEAARGGEEQRRVKRFVQPYPVLSLGPMASSRAVELLLEHRLQGGLTALEALVAATALAHEIPLVTTRPETYAGIPELELLRPY
jgi:predicted nucleic acid-binding protein